ncbi:MAG: hypothetical protein A2046_08455 [Bacteroidetes bacterium GWA2_30_7]|nr:MAG: hypothetical protein A2046_08455 [Bacteroidetes bacterium GWA2_30_7]
MKTITLTLVISLLNLLGFAQIPTNGIVAYYPFNGNANDESGNGYNGTSSGATLANDRFGNANSAYSFNGVNNYIDLSTNASSFNFQQPATVSFWVKSSVDDVHAIYSVTNNIGDNGTTIVIGNNTTDKLTNEIITISNYSSSTDYYIAGYTTTNRNLLFDNNWHNIICVFDGVSAKIYLDNNLLSITTGWGTNNGQYGNITSPTRAVLGTRYANSSYGVFHNGGLDDILVYNRVLNTTEIATIYNYTGCTTSIPTANDSSACGSGTYTLTATGGTNYLWYNTPIGGTYINIGSTYTTPFLTSTTTYYVANYDGSCESARDTATITINPLPNLSIIDFNTGYCVNSIPVSLSGSPSGGVFSGNGVSGDLFIPASANIGSNSISYSYTNPSTGCSNTINQSVTINNSPSLSISGLNPNFNLNDASVTLYGTPSGGTFVGTGVTGNSFNPSIAGVGSHTVVYIYTDGNGCSNAYCETDDITTSKSEILTKESGINVYPNPNAGTFNVSLSLNKSEKVNIRVLNNLGDVIYTESNRRSKGNYNNPINLSSQPNGIYYIDVEIGEKNYSEIISLIR